jgi:Tol biopolymer transport system component
MPLRLWSRFAAVSRLASCVFALLLVAAAPHAGAAYPGQNGKIAYESDDGVHSGISVMNPDGTGQLALTGGGEERDPIWSPNGTRIAFSHTDPNPPEGHMNVYVMNADGTGALNLTPGANDGQGHTGIDPTWSPGGNSIAYNDNANIWVMDAASGAGKSQLTTGPQADLFPAWSPNATKIAFTRDLDIWVMNADGSAPTRLTSATAAERGADWSPDGSKIVYDRSGQIWSMNADGSGQIALTGGAGQGGVAPAWSPDGTKIVFSSNAFTAPNGYDIFIMNPDGTGVTRLNSPVPIDDRDPNWQPTAVLGYPRPRGATPLRVSLVPAYQACASPNRTHGAPLAFGSCTPPFQASTQLTIGTPDANGRGANSFGSVLYNALTSDVRVTASITDVRGQALLDDYSGQLQLDASVRITDRRSGAAANEPATVADTGFPVTVPCATTTATNVGSTCSVSTTFNAVMAGSITANARSIWALGATKVYDGGADGVASTSPNTLFMTEGVFVP